MCSKCNTIFMYIEIVLSLWYMEMSCRMPQLFYFNDKKGNSYPFLINHIIVNRADGLENNNITCYPCWSAFMQKHGSSSSCLYCVFAKSILLHYPIVQVADG